MERVKTFFNLLWQLLPKAGHASEYHPSVDGGAIPIPFIVSQRQVMNDLSGQRSSPPPLLQPPNRSFTCYVQGYSSLPMRDRALAALRCAHLTGARHLIPDISRCALDTGLRASDIAMTARGHSSPGWSRRENLILRVAESLYQNESIDEHLWQELKQIYTPQQVLDLVLCCAAFHLCVYPN